MNRTLLRFAFLVPLLWALFDTSLFARPVPLWPFKKLAAESDLVAILQPIENKPTKDVFPGVTGPVTNRFTGVETRFQVQAVLKNKGDAPPSELTVLHFLYSTNVAIANGALFAQFVIGPVQYQRQTLKDGKPVRTGSLKMLNQQPTWLAFLKRRTDGRFEPVTGQMESAFSFRELDEVTFSTHPGAIHFMRMDATDPFTERR